MCGATASLGAQSFGVGMSTVGSIFSAMSQKDMLKSQARMAEINAKIADGNARNAIRVGTIEETRVKLATAQAKSTQRTQITSSGIDIAGSNTALARLTGTDVIGEVDAQTVRSNALRAAWGHRFDAGNMRRQATSARASAASISPALAGLTSLINGAGQVASSWYSMNKAGAFDKPAEQAPAQEQPTVSISSGASPSYTPFDSSLMGPPPQPSAMRHPWWGSW